MSGDAMNVLPAAKSAIIASGGISWVPYCTHLPRKSIATMSGRASARRENAHLPRKLIVTVSCGSSARIENVHLPRKCRESMSGDAMNVLPAAKSTKIASGGTSVAPYCSHLPRKRNVTVSGGAAARTENAHLGGDRFPVSHILNRQSHGCPCRQ